MTEENAHSGATAKPASKYVLMDVDHVIKLENVLDRVGEFLTRLERDTVLAIDRVKGIGIEVDDAGMRRLAEVSNARDSVERVSGALALERQLPTMRGAVHHRRRKLGDDNVHILAPTEATLNAVLEAIEATGVRS